MNIEFADASNKSNKNSSNKNYTHEYKFQYYIYNFYQNPATFVEFFSQRKGVEMKTLFASVCLRPFLVWS